MVYAVRADYSVAALGKQAAKVPAPTALPPLDGPRRFPPTSGNLNEMSFLENLGLLDCLWPEDGAGAGKPRTKEDGFRGLPKGVVGGGRRGRQVESPCLTRSQEGARLLVSSVREGVRSLMVSESGNPGWKRWRAITPEAAEGSRDPITFSPCGESIAHQR